MFGGITGQLLKGHESVNLTQSYVFFRDKFTVKEEAKQNRVTRIGLKFKVFDSSLATHIIS